MFGPIILECRQCKGRWHWSPEHTHVCPPNTEPKRLIPKQPIDREPVKVVQV